MPDAVKGVQDAGTRRKLAGQHAALLEDVARHVAPLPYGVASEITHLVRPWQAVAALGDR